MGSGKTTLGKKLAEKISIEFIDLDEIIIKNTGESINNIFNKKGEDFFREEERKALQSMLRKKSFIMAVGGGTPCFFNNMELMKKTGITIYLKLTPEKIFDRLKGETKQRPLLNKLDNESLLEYIKINLEKREKWYLQSEIILEETEHSPEIIYNRILTA